MAKDLFKLLVDLEKNLHRKSTRRSKEKLNQYLHDDFEEIGSSGKTYNKDQIIEELLNEMPITINALDFKLKILSKDIALLKYKTKTNLRNDLPRTTPRSSIWKKYCSKCRMVFHQGTVIQN